MSEEQIPGGRVEKADIFLPFSPSLNEAYDTQPTLRVVIDVSESSAMGFLQRGFYLKINDTTYFIRKKEISVFTNSQVSRVLEFLMKTKREFTIDVRRDRTVSGHQYVQLTDIGLDKCIYTLSDYRVFNSLWQEIEFELYENTYSPSMARFTGERLIWYTKLLPQHSLVFTNMGKMVLNYMVSQGHLEIYRIEKEGEFVIPVYLFSSKESLRFYNHEVQGKIDVIPLGSERRIISIAKETQVISTDHDPINLDVGQYLLFHQRPRRDGVD